MDKLPVTILMITLNEAWHLRQVLPGLRVWAEDVMIVDSLSSDDTVDVALQHGVQVVQRPFTTFSEQWNFALQLPIHTPWTMKVDPDERASDELLTAIREVTRDPQALRGYEVNWRLWFLGRPLHVFVPVRRLWQTGQANFSDVIVNEHPEIEGVWGRLSGCLDHLDSRNLHDWYEKQNRYTTMEAVMRAEGRALAAEPRLFGTTLERRMWLKKNYWRVPFRHDLYRLWLWGRSGAWRDGLDGWLWARHRAEVMRMIEMKTREMRKTGKIPALPRGRVGDWHPAVADSPLQVEMRARTGERLGP